MARRARGANAIMAGAFETAYGTSPGSGYYKLPVVSMNLGDEQALIKSDLLGFGREPLEPSDDVVNNAGDMVVPVDVRYFGFHLKGLFGAPTTTQGLPATGAYVFSANPAANSVLTVNGTAFTFKASVAGATDILRGATLAESIANAVVVLNASADANVTPATYSADTDLTTITITHDTIGTAGNTFTIVAGSSPASNATASGATLAGGSTSGPYNHVFTSGVVDLPSASIEVGMTDVSKFFMNYGVMYDTLSIPLQRSGLLNATFGLIAQGERTPTGATGAGTPTELVIKRFSQGLGVIKRDGVPLGRIQSGTAKFSNALDKDESIRPDGRIGGADSGQLMATSDIVVRFGDSTLYDLAVNKTPLEVTFNWTISATEKLSIVYHRVRLPKSKLPVTGPGGINATFATEGMRDPTLGRSVTVTLVNDVASYA